MKRLLVLVSSMLFIYVSALGNSKVSCTDKLVADCHPRLILNETEFGQLKKMVEGDNVVSMLHNHLIGVADVSVADEERYISVRRTDGKSTACPILTRIVSCAYAYKMTGQKRYLEKVISDLNDVCSFDGWYVRSYLDVAQVSTAVSIAYDWLCDRLPESVKTKVVHSLKTFALETSRMSDRNEYTWWYKRIGNWNQVCNAGLVCAAFAIYEHCPELAQEVIDDAVRTNKVAVEGIYGPDGAYPEGSSYWHFGSIYQVLLLTLLDDISGTDYGISSSPGFMDTGLFRMFACGSNGCQFNYGDNVLSTDFNYPLFYFAYKRNEPSMLYNEVRLMKKPEYSGSDHCAFLTLAIKYAMRMDLNSLTPPAQKFYSAQGNVPVMMCRSGWGQSDHYLGIKGGKDSELHGHMDGGTFVYYADHVRWAMDIKREAYYKLRPGLKELGGSIADYSQNSLRWKIFRYNCRQHNTLTVNDKDHNVDAFVHMIATENTPDRMSATFDLTPLFDGDLVKAERTAALCDESHVEIKDVLKAPADGSAHVRWTMVTAAQPEITPDGILLTKGSAIKKLSTSGGDVTYRIWSSNIEDYADVLRVEGKAIETPVSKNTYICGYEVDVPADKELILITTIM